MKTFVFLIALCCVAMAQDINGISIGGTLDNPTLVNNSGKAVIAYVVQKFDTNGVNTVSTVPHVYNLVRGVPIQGPLGMMFGIQRSTVNHNTGQHLVEGDTIRWEIKGVVFADGSHYGTNFSQLARMFGNFRQFARNLQAQGRANWHATVGGLNAPIPTNDQQAIAYALSGLPESDWDAAVGRLSALPDVVHVQ